MKKKCCRIKLYFVKKRSFFLQSPASSCHGNEAEMRVRKRKTWIFFFLYSEENAEFFNFMKLYRALQKLQKNIRKWIFVLRTEMMKILQRELFCSLKIILFLWKLKERNIFGVLKWTEIRRTPFQLQKLWRETLKLKSFK